MCRFRRGHCKTANQRSVLISGISLNVLKIDKGLFLDNYIAISVKGNLIDFDLHAVRVGVGTAMYMYMYM